MADSKGRAAYEAHVAANAHPKRFKSWDQLPEHTKALFTPPAKKAAKKPAKGKKS